MFQIQTIIYSPGRTEISSAVATWRLFPVGVDMFVWGSMFLPNDNSICGSHWQ
jgi:hypothetical protein